MQKFLSSLTAVLLMIFALTGAAQSSFAQTQTLNVTGGVQSYGSLNNTAVTMTGKSELHVTGANNPIAGSNINLASPDAWFWLDNVRPQTVADSYLGQFKVNGAAAVRGANVRVVQYALGTVIIPQAPSFQPLEAFSEPNFGGDSKKFGQYTYYNTAAALGALNRNIRSFKLKRGYMATFAAQPNGTGASKIFVAQDSDVEVWTMPANLSGAQFVRVLPWRWVSKKGSCDIWPDALNASWHYNWNNNLTSSLNWEYVPIRQQRWWPDYPTNQPDSTHQLGFNEPDNSGEDAYKTLNNGSVDEAIAVWPELMASGLRLGSPAVTDGGKAWLYSFMDKAIAKGLRVDYIAIHNYQAGNSPDSLKNWLQDIYNRYHLPIWVTEFNNGANWTAGPKPTLAQNADAIGGFIDMMDKTPWIERYAIFSNVEDVRKMVDAAGALTPAGVVYRDNASPIGYIQENYPSGGRRNIAHLPLDGDTLDTSGYGNHGVAQGTPTYVAGQREQALQFGGDNFVRMQENISHSSALSFAGWVYWDGGGDWQRVFDFGNGVGSYLFLTPRSGDGTLRFGIKNGGGEQMVETAELPIGQWTYIAVTLDGSGAKIYLDGQLKASNGGVNIKADSFVSTSNFLGKSQYPADPLFKGRMDDVYVLDYALTGAQVAVLMSNHAPKFVKNPISRGPARVGAAFNATIEGAATDADAEDKITYSKVSGPAWLAVAPNGALSGTPTMTDAGIDKFVVAAADSKSPSTNATLTIDVVLSDGIYRLTPRHATGSALTVLGAGSASPLGISAYKDANAQKFLLDLQSDGTYRLRIAPVGNRTLELPGGTTANGTRVQLGRDDGSAAQRWTILPTDNGWFKIVPVNNAARSLELDAHGTADGTPAQLWDYLNGDNQQWKFGAVVVNLDTRVQISLDTPTIEVGESAGTAMIKVVRSGDLSSTVSVDYATSDGTARAGSDYTATSGTLDFAASETSKNIVVPINNDSFNEDDETFGLTLNNARGDTESDVQLGALTKTTVKIVDNDAMPKLSVADAKIIEGDSGIQNAQFSITLSVASGRPVTIYYHASNNNAATNNAVDGIDYRSVKGILKFSPGQTRATASIPVNGDTDVEADETFLLKLDGAINATLARAQATGTIVNDDKSEIPAAFSVSLTPSAPTNGQSVTATPVMAGKTSADFLYQWFVNGIGLPDSDRETLDISKTFGHRGDVISVVVSQRDASGDAIKVSQSVTVANSAPFAFSGTASATAGIEAVVPFAAYRNPGGADADGDALTYRIVSGPRGGNARFVVGAQGQTELRYAARAGFIGVDVIRFVAVDAAGAASRLATLAIGVKAAPRARPTTQDASAQTRAGVSVDVPVSGANADGSPIKFKRVGGPRNGVGEFVQLDDGTTVLRYTSRSNFAGVEEVRFVALTAAGYPSQVATIRITVTPSQSAALGASSHSAAASASAPSSAGGS